MKGVVERAVIQNLWAFSGDRNIFRQWCQQSTAAPGYVKGEREDNIHRMVREIDLGSEMGNIMFMLAGQCGAMLKYGTFIWRRATRSR